MNDKTITITPSETDACMGCPGIGYGTCELWPHVPDDVHPDVNVLPVDYGGPRPELCPLKLGYTFRIEETPQ